MLPDGLNRRSLGNPLIKQALAFSELQAISLTKGGRHAVRRCFKSSVFSVPEGDIPCLQSTYSEPLNSEH